MSTSNSATTSNGNKSQYSPIFANDNDDEIPIKTKPPPAALQQKEQSFLVDDDDDEEEEEETFENDNIILNGEWDDNDDEEENRRHNNATNNDLTTPLLARDNTNDLFMELEMSYENMKSISSQSSSKAAAKATISKIQNNNNSNNNIREQTKKQKRLTWDKVSSNLQVQWHDDFNSFNDNEEYNNNDHNLNSTTITNNNINHSNNNQRQQPSNLDMNISIASVFLRDYEYSRPCSLSPNLDSITPIQLEMYNSRFSSSHQFLVCVAMITLFLASFFEGQSKNGFFDIIFQTLFTSFAVLIFTMDIVMRGYYDDDNLFTMNIPTLYTRKTRARKWKVPMLVMLMAVTLETAIKVLMNSNTLFVWSSMFKPIVFFYVSSKARDGKLLLFIGSCIIPLFLFVTIFFIYNKMNLIHYLFFLCSSLCFDKS